MGHAGGMDMFHLAVIAAFVVAYGLVSGRIDRSVITGPMVFVGFGLLIGSNGLDVVDLPLDNGGVELLAEATLALLLFSDAFRIDISLLHHEYELPTRMLAIGLPLTIGFGTLVALALFDVPLAVAALMAAVLAPTDAALGQAVLTSDGVPVRIRQTLNVESGLNDGIALPAVTVFTAIVVEAEQLSTPASWIALAAEQVGYGVVAGAAVGLCGGLAIRYASNADWMAGVYRQIAVFGVAVAAFSGADAVGGNGFVAAFTAGLAFGATARDVCPHVEEFTEDTADMLAMISFIVFGAIVVGPSLDDLDWRIALSVLFTLLLVRPLAIAISLLGSNVRWPTVLVLGWFGPRGLASILFGVIVAEEAGGADLGPLFAVMSWTVLISIVVHGLSAEPLVARYGAWWKNNAHESMAEAISMKSQRLRSSATRADRT